MVKASNYCNYLMSYNIDRPSFEEVSIAIYIIHTNVRMIYKELPPEFPVFEFIIIKYYT